MSDDMQLQDRDAADWFAARQRGVMSVEERLLYQAWLRNPSNKNAMRELDKVWSMLGGGAIAAPQGRAAMVAAMCAASVLIGVLSLGTNSHFWTALDWTNR